MRLANIKLVRWRRPDSDSDNVVNFIDAKSGRVLPKQVVGYPHTNKGWLMRLPLQQGFRYKVLLAAFVHGLPSDFIWN